MATISELIATTDARVLQQPGGVDPATVPVGRIRSAGRQVAPGDVYWALPRAGCDGTQQSADAFARGAVAAVAPRPIEAPPDRWVLQVTDTQEALHRWALWRRRHFCGTLIVIAGELGATTARQMMHIVLGSRLRGASESVSHDPHLGVPLGISALEPHHDYALLELAATSCGEFASLMSLAMPKVAVITPMAHTTMAHFGDRQRTTLAYGKLLATLPPDGRAVLADDHWLRPVASSCPAPITWVGTSDGCDLLAENVRTSEGRLRFTIAGVTFRVPAWGGHLLTAALCAIAIGRTMGMDFSAIAAALEKYRPIPDHCKVIQLRGATIINDPRDADLAGMYEVLEILHQIDAPGRRILVCGDLAEPDARCPARHWQLGRDAVEIAGVHLLIACGQYARYVVAGARAAGVPRPKAIACRTFADSLPYLGQATQPGDVVLIKGFAFLEIERLAEALGAYPLRRTA